MMHTFDPAATAAKSAARKAFLVQIVPFAVMLAQKRGTAKELHSWKDTKHMKWELKGFGGFSFEVETDISAEGGNSVVVKPCNGKPLQHRLLDVFWPSPAFDAETCKVRAIALDGDWESKLLQLATSWEVVAAQIDAKLSETEKKELQAKKRMDEEHRLYEEAQRLGFHLPSPRKSETRR